MVFVEALEDSNCSQDYRQDPRHAATLAYWRFWKENDSYKTSEKALPKYIQMSGARFLYPVGVLGFGVGWGGCFVVLGGFLLLPGRRSSSICWVRPRS